MVAKGHKLRMHSWIFFGFEQTSLWGISHDILRGLNFFDLWISPFFIQDNLGVEKPWPHWKIHWNATLCSLPAKKNILCFLNQQWINLNCHRLLFILNWYGKWRASVILTPHPLFFLRKLPEYSACSYWSTAEHCENRQLDSIGQ